MSKIQGYYIQEQWRHRQDHVSGDRNRHWKPPLHCIKALHPTTQALRVGAERNRNTRKSRNHRKKHIPMGITSCNSSQKECIRGTSQKENVRGLQENKQTLT